MYQKKVAPQVVPQRLHSLTCRRSKFKKEKTSSYPPSAHHMGGRNGRREPKWRLHSHLWPRRPLFTVQPFTIIVVAPQHTGVTHRFNRTKQCCQLELAEPHLPQITLEPQKINLINPPYAPAGSLRQVLHSCRMQNTPPQPLNGQTPAV